VKNLTYIPPTNNHHDQIEITLVASFTLHLSLAVQNALHEAFEHDYITRLNSSPYSLVNPWLISMETLGEGVK